MLTEQQVETFIYTFRAAIDQLTAVQKANNTTLNQLQQQINTLSAAQASNSGSTGSNGNIPSLVDSYPTNGGIVHKLKHFFNAAVKFLSDVAIDGTLSLTNNPLAANYGGTGRNTLTGHAVVLGNGVGNVAFAAPSTADFVLTDNGAAADPSFKAVVNKFNTRTGTITLTKADVDAVEQALGTGDSPTFAALTLTGLATLSSVKLGFGNTTGAGTPLLGANCPATTLTAPYTWFTLTAADGSTVYIAGWK